MLTWARRGKNSGIPYLVRFWEKVSKSDSDNCWLWLGGTNSTGYGKLCRNKSTVYAHRISWELHYGNIPDGLCVLHRCDNRLCVNPNHLFLGTKIDNMHDMYNKKRNRCRRGADGKFMKMF